VVRGTCDVASHATRPPSVRALTDLTRLAFAEFPGVVVASDAATRWFVSRPGFDSGASAAAWVDEHPIASVYLTRVPMSLGGQWLDVGVVDTVMVSPAHRGKGLARGLMQHAIDSCRQAGMAAVQLYTTPGSAGHHLYRKLGFEDWRLLRYWHRQPRPMPAPSVRWEQGESQRLGEAVSLLQSLAGRYSGVPLLGDELGRWRWLDRPDSMLATLWWLEQDGAPQTATSTFVNLTDGPRTILLKDVAGCTAASLADLCAGLGPGPMVALADAADAPLAEALAGAGFEPGQDEAAMLLPLGGPSATPVQESRSRPWYPLAESVIGA
jgi:GNAT superfamily N-acetyltransferase